MGKRAKAHLKAEIRPSLPGDEKFLIEWFLQPGVLRWFPLQDRLEVEDAARICMEYAKKGAALTALIEGVPVGFTNLYLQPYEKLSHQCLFAILVDEKYRGRGIGADLMRSLMKLAKERFGIELLHLEMYRGNPAYDLYRRLGFEEYGVHPKFLREGGRYWDRILMQKRL